MTSTWNPGTAPKGRIIRQARDERSWCHAGFAFLVTAVVLLAAPVIAQEQWTPPPHVRPEHGVRSLVEEAARRSPLIRELIDRLERLDVTVYIRARAFLVQGSIGLSRLAAAATRQVHLRDGQIVS